MGSPPVTGAPDTTVTGAPGTTVTGASGTTVTGAPGTTVTGAPGTTAVTRYYTTATAAYGSTMAIQYGLMPRALTATLFLKNTYTCLPICDSADSTKLLLNNNTASSIDVFFGNTPEIVRREEAALAVRRQQLGLPTLEAGFLRPYPDLQTPLQLFYGAILFVPLEAKPLFNGAKVKSIQFYTYQQQSDQLCATVILEVDKWWWIKTRFIDVSSLAIDPHGKPVGYKGPDRQWLFGPVIKEHTSRGSQGTPENRTGT